MRLPNPIDYLNPAGEDDYRGSHRAPRPEDDVPMHDVEHFMPDYYQHPKWYFCAGSEPGLDWEAASVIRAKRGKPWSRVRIYRAVPFGVKTINPGDWVTQVRGYALWHLRSNLGGGRHGRILSKVAYAGELFTDGSSHFEWGWWPMPEKHAEWETVRREHLKSQTPTTQADDLHKRLDLLEAKLGAWKLKL